MICAKSGGIPEVAAFGKQVETYPATDVDALAGIMDQALMDAQSWRKGGFRDEAAQSHADEVTKRFRTAPEVIAPSKPLKGLSGHLWEQTVLPIKLNGQLLWSPCNTGPLGIKNQIITLHDVIALDRPEWFNPRFVRLYSELLPRLTARVRHILTGSHYSKERFIERFAIKAEKITVTPYGVSEDFSPRSEEEIQSIREIYKIPHKRYLLMLASREPR